LARLTVGGRRERDHQEIGNGIVDLSGEDGERVAERLTFDARRQGASFGADRCGATLAAAMTASCNPAAAAIVSRNISAQDARASVRAILAARLAFRPTCDGARYPAKPTMSAAASQPVMR